MIRDHPERRMDKASTDEAGAAGPALSETSARTPYVRYKQDL